MLSMRHKLSSFSAQRATKPGANRTSETGLDSLYLLMCHLPGLFCVFGLFFRGQEDRRGPRGVIVVSALHPTPAATDGVVGCHERETTVVDLGSQLS